MNYMKNFFQKVKNLEPKTIIIIGIVLALCAGGFTFRVYKSSTPKSVVAKVYENGIVPTVGAVKITNTPEIKRDKIEIPELFAEFAVDKSQTIGLPLWKTSSNSDLLPVSWSAETPLKEINSERFQKSGKLIVTINGKPLYGKNEKSGKDEGAGEGEGKREDFTSNTKVSLIEKDSKDKSLQVVYWNIILKGTKDNIETLSLSVNQKGNSTEPINVEKIFKEAGYEFEIKKTDTYKESDGFRRFYEVVIPNKKVFWIDYSTSNYQDNQYVSLTAYYDQKQARELKYSVDYEKERAPQKTNIKSGLLLGLKNLQADYDARYVTLWIAPKEEHISIKKGEGFLITPYGNDFWKIAINRFRRNDNQKFGAQDVVNASYGVTIRDFVSFIANQSKPIKYNPDTYTLPNGCNYEERTEDLLFIGNKYVCMDRNEVYHMSNNFDRINVGYSNLYPITDLGNDSKIVDLKEIYGDSIDNIINQYVPPKDKFNVDLMKPIYNSSAKGNDYIIVRENGIFVPKLRFKDLNNGIANVRSTVSTGIMNLPELPEVVTAHNKLVPGMDIIKTKITDVKDAASSPNNDMLVILKQYGLDVYEMDSNGNIGERVYQLDGLYGDYQIVMLQWSSGNYVKEWDKSMDTYLHASNPELGR